MALMEDLALLTEPIQFESIDQDNYPDFQDQRPLAPPPLGIYTFKVLKTRETEKNGYPVLTIIEAEIVEPFEYGRKLDQLWKDIYTKPFLRKGRPASSLVDLVRAYDQTRRVSSIQDGLNLLAEFRANGLTFRARLDWTAYDGEWAQEQIAAAGGKNALSKDVLNGIYNKARIKSMYKFPRQVDGSFSPVWGGIEGTKEIEAKLDLTRFFPSLDVVKLGPATN